MKAGALVDPVWRRIGGLTGTVLVRRFLALQRLRLTVERTTPTAATTTGTAIACNDTEPATATKKKYVPHSYTAHASWLLFRFALSPRVSKGLNDQVLGFRIVVK